MSKIFTIGFTKKSAEDFFELIKKNNINLIIDVRLNNVSQLAGFSKYPDIKYFLEVCSNCKYISDKNFSPEESTLKRYRDKKIDWFEYVDEFNDTMEKRKIKEYILTKYDNKVKQNNICFLCSEETANKCHRRLIAEYFSQLFNLEIINL